jgi:aldehyde:ferredoxin oxidoreductase
LDWEIIKQIGKKVYGSTDSVDPMSGYKDKAFPAYWHGHRSVIKDSLPVDDQVFPRIFSNKTGNHFACAGDLEGPQFEFAMFKSATGMDWSESQFEYHLERIIQLERNLLIRNNNRSRTDDETIIPYLEYPENRVNPFIGHPVCLDRIEFGKVMDAYYKLRGWSTATGQPTPETIKKFNLPE